MKLLKLVFVLAFFMNILACNSNAKKTTHIEATESMEMEDDIDSDDEDETEFLESAMEALKNGDKELAVVNIMKAVDYIKGYVGEMDDPVHAKVAITSLIDLATKIKSGTNMTADQLEEALLKLELFSNDDLDVDDDEIEEES